MRKNSQTANLFMTKDWQAGDFLNLHSLKNGVTQNTKSLALIPCEGFWLGWPDSDRRVPESKSGALPLGYTPIYLQR